LLDGDVDDAGGTVIINLDRGGWLGMTHFGQAGSNGDTVFAIEEGTAPVSASSVVEERTTFMKELRVWIAPFSVGGMESGVGDMLGSAGLLLRKEWPPVRLRALGSDK
jgi:hypothetical protein